MPAPGTAHGLGPHVVGRRVVVRRLVPGETGPSGGPAMTDVLGTCLAWDAAVCVVAPESGPPVTIPLTEIVTGKPVPPRGSVRQRVSAHEAEVRALPLWTAPTTEPLGEWLLRVVTGERGRRSRRANSCLAVGDPGLPLETAAARVTAFYAGHGRPALVQVAAGSPVEDALLAQGWTMLEPVDAPYLVGSLVMSLRAAGSDEGVETTLDGTRALATLTVDGVEVGRGRAELNGDWLGVHGLEVAEAYRRHGIGRRLMAGLLEAGAEQGASTVWLEVDRDNTAAWMLYAGLGLREHHLCRYLAAPAS
ncbi:MAG TPA: GNAT family N-acetyltransferase [Nocardioides sp.]|nr:GNAT family N-acetyltransferase [Nocardioides sp.]